MTVARHSTEHRIPAKAGASRKAKCTKTAAAAHIGILAKAGAPPSSLPFASATLLYAVAPDGTMETVETIVYLVIAVTLGGLVIAFIAGWDAGKTYENVKSMFGDEGVEEYIHINSTQLAKVAVEVWESCGLGSTLVNTTVYVDDSALLNKSALFNSVKRYGLCKTLQSADEDCGSAEDVNFPDLSPPRHGPTVLFLACNNATRRLDIS